MIIYGTAKNGFIGAVVMRSADHQKNPRSLASVAGGVSSFYSLDRQGDVLKLAELNECN